MRTEEEVAKGWGVRPEEVVSVLTPGGSCWTTHSDVAMSLAGKDNPDQPFFFDGLDYQARFPVQGPAKEEEVSDELVEFLLSK